MRGLLGDCTLLCSLTGYRLNRGIVINRLCLSRWLLRAGGLEAGTVHSLLNPKDAQDVPRAIKLMKAVISLRHLPAWDDPQENTELDALKLLGYVLESILEPYINLDYSLEDQLISLSCHAHLLCAFFVNDRNEFIPNQLYFDTQALIKSTYLSVFKQKRLDPHGVFDITDTGDDDLEKKFGLIRMDSAHRSGFNYRQGLEYDGHANDIRQIYVRHPNLEPPQRRLSFTRDEHLDHISRRHRRGDIHIRRIEDPRAWKMGRVRAQAILHDHSKLRPASYAFESLFSNPEKDAMCPWGEGIYPGVHRDYQGEDASALISGGDPDPATSVDTSTGTSLSTPGVSLID